MDGLGTAMYHEGAAKYHILGKHGWGRWTEAPPTIVVVVAHLPQEGYHLPWQSR